MAIATPVRPAGELGRAIDDYLTYLRVERGLAPATMRAYRADLGRLRDEPRARRGWAGGAGRCAAVPRRPRARGGRTDDPGLAPTACGGGPRRSAASTGSRSATG